jgi:hypothetical protein
VIVQTDPVIKEKEVRVLLAEIYLQRLFLLQRV